MFRLSFFASALVTVVLAAVACSGAGSGGWSGSSSGNTRYPRRPPGCPLQMFNGLPEVKVYDDIGMVQVDCYLDESEVACLSRLRTEACRMGADIVYNIPKKAARPVERGMVYRAQAAHTRDSKKQDDVPAPVDAGSGPVEPLLPVGGAVPKAPAPDGGAP